MAMRRKRAVLVGLGDVRGVLRWVERCRPWREPRLKAGSLDEWDGYWDGLWSTVGLVAATGACGGDWANER